VYRISGSHRTCEPTSASLRFGAVFGRPGLVGETEVRKRKDLVRRFQEDDDVPFFVLSVKAGGAGLNQGEPVDRGNDCGMSASAKPNTAIAAAFSASSCGAILSSVSAAV
jgi:hypothetical protein